MNLKAALSPYVRLAHDFRSPTSMALGPCWVNDHAIHYFKAGSGSYQIGTEQYPIQPGVAYLVRPHVLFSICAAPGTSLHMLNIHFDVVERDDSASLDWPYPANNERREIPIEEQLSLDNHALDCLPGRLTVADPAAFEGLFARVHHLFGLKDFVSSLQTKSAMLELLAYLFRVSQQGNAAASQKHERAMRLAMIHVQTHYQVQISLKTAAAVAGLSETHFASLFRAYYGITLHRLVTDLRMEKAKRELSLTDMPIKTLAQTVGYASVHHFSRAFKQNTGLSPAAFRHVHTPVSLGKAEEDTG